MFISSRLHSQRPIVAFSIENRIMVNAKQRRIQKSREKNPLWKGYDKTNSSGKVENNGGKDRRQRFAGKGNQVDETKGEASSYSGVTGKPGVNKMRSKFNLKSQAMMHKESLKQEKKAKKRTKELINRKKEEVASRKEPKVLYQVEMSFTLTWTFVAIIIVLNSRVVFVSAQAR